MAEVPGPDDVAAWSPAERAQVARLLDAALERPRLTPRRARRRRLFLVITLAGAAVLVPWIVYLGLTLPVEKTVAGWRRAWVGFDVALLASLAVTGILALKRRQMVVMGCIVSATLLVVDAWFDVVLSRRSSDFWLSLGMAIAIELPVAYLLVSTAVLVLRRMTAVVAHLRGQIGTPPSLWRQELIMLPPSVDQPPT